MPRRQRISWQGEEGRIRADFTEKVALQDHGQSITYLHDGLPRVYMHLSGWLDWKPLRDRGWKFPGSRGGHSSTAALDEMVKHPSLSSELFAAPFICELSLATGSWVIFALILPAHGQWLTLSTTWLGNHLPPPAQPLTAELVSHLPSPRSPVGWEGVGGQTQGSRLS